MMEQRSKNQMKKKRGSPVHRTQNSGFTLVELMVSVALVGILAAIGITNFMRFAARARQSEAKIGLANLYAAQKAFATESGSYTYCVRQAGFVIDALARYYVIGFLGSDNFDCGPTGNATCNAYTWNPTLPCSVDCAAFDAGISDNMAQATVGVNPGIPPLISCANINAIPGIAWIYSASQSAFTAVAIGNISTSNVYDMWTINENKQLVNIRSGI